MQTEPKRAELSKASARTAWLARALVLSLPGRSAVVQRFLAAARDHDHEGFTVPAAAAAVYVSIRRLYGIVEEALGFPPGMVLDLVRLESVAAAISGSDASFMNISEKHGYSTPPAMNRQFVRFVGVAPGEYRARALLRQPRHEEKISRNR